jgi:hypothetical protein
MPLCFLLHKPSKLDMGQGGGTCAGEQNMTRAQSRACQLLTGMHYPTVQTYQVNVEEVEKPLYQYRTLNDFSAPRLLGA